MIPDPHNAKEKYLKVFNEAYQELNDQQRTAVDQVDGPVMVIAGPGTGKTQILAIRIGQILLKTDTQPHNILCLTYTDAASISMRERLVEIIGPDAHRVHIHTFHSFCNQVIQENLGIFGDYRQLEPISDLERIKFFEELMIRLPVDQQLKRLKRDPSYVIKQLQHLFSLMKKENYSSDDIESVANVYLTDLKNDPNMIYKKGGKGYKKGDFKQKRFDEEERKMNNLVAGAGLFKDFQDIMRANDRYDFDDMISWVMIAFKNDADLLLQYQERYHYFLVDEFQDTNGAQKQLLDLLISYWEDQPNVFVVGDDDQAIYKFQGANIGNISEFYNQYQPTTAVLIHNYRSTQEILDAAMGVIYYNQERIIHEPNFQLDKKLISSVELESQDTEVIIRSFQNPTQESAALVSDIVRQADKNVDLSNTAVIYRNHSQVDKIVEVLEKKGIPLNIKRRVDVLKIPLVKNILKILTYINAQFNNQGRNDALLFEIMHYSFFEISASDISKIIWASKIHDHSSDENQDSSQLNHFIDDNERLKKLSLHSPENIVALNDRLHKWVSDMNDVTLQVLFQNVVNEGMILSHILSHTDRSWLLQVLGTLFDLIKSETAKNPDLSLDQFLSMIEEMKHNKIPLQINKIVSSNKGIHFLTAHSSKGLEFENVYILGATKNIWDGRNSNWGKFSYPEGINGDNVSNIEDERRLFYVAMTRSMFHLNISYSLLSENGKGLGPSQFVDELRAVSRHEVTPCIVPMEDIVDFQFHVLKKKEGKVVLLDHDLIDRILKGYKLSVTGLNKYLKCPVTFYFESILRVPMARTKYLGFGRAIHFAFENFYRLLKSGSQDSEILIQNFDKGMYRHKAHFTNREYEDMKAYGHKVLQAYYQERLTNLKHTVESEQEVKIENAEFNGIPIKGILDRVEFNGIHVEVIDYKTGNFNKSYTKVKLKTPDDKNPLGGDYWRQIVFYKILINSDKKRNWNMKSGQIDFVEPDPNTGEFKQVDFNVSDEQIKIVGSQIEDVWHKINDHQFEKGCGEDDCYWCEFVQNDYVMDFSAIMEEEDVEMEEITFGT